MTWRVTCTLCRREETMLPLPVTTLPMLKTVS